MSADEIKRTKEEAEALTVFEDVKKTIGLESTRTEALISTDLTLYSTISSPILYELEGEGNRRCKECEFMCSTGNELGRHMRNKHPRKMKKLRNLNGTKQPSE